MRQSNNLNGNLKAGVIEPAEWMQDDEVSNYNTFSIPYGPKFHASKIQRLLYTKDILLNAEWSKPKERVLHRHPAFFGATAAEAMSDSCGACPSPQTNEEREAAEEEKKIYVHGPVTFLTDNPGRQAIGSFHPITDDDWTEMAYVSNIANLCQAIVDTDVQLVRKICSDGDVDINQRDYCGRSPLHLAVIASSAEVVRCLLDHGSRIIPRLADGRTSLHLAAERGDKHIMKAILDKSESNEEQQIAKEHSAPMNAASADDQQGTHSNTDGSDIDQSDSEESADDITEGSFVQIRRGPIEDTVAEDDDQDLPDVLDVNVVAWDKKVTALHTGIAFNNTSVVETLVSDYGADPMLPIKLVHAHNNSPSSAIMPLVLATSLQGEDMLAQTRSLLSLGASSAQADMKLVTALQYFVVAAPRALPLILDHDGPAGRRVLNHVTFPDDRHYYGNGGFDTALSLAIRAKDEGTAQYLLQHGAEPEVSFESFKHSRPDIHASPARYGPGPPCDENMLKEKITQPVFLAAKYELPDLVWKLIDLNVDVNSINQVGYSLMSQGHSYHRGSSLLDTVLAAIGKLENPVKEKEVEFPEPLKSDDHYSVGLEPGSYRFWKANHDLKHAKEEYSRDEETAEQERTKIRPTGAKEMKQSALQSLLDRYRSLERTLRARGAKTFKDLYPNSPEPRERQDHHSSGTYRRYTPHKTAFSFRGSGGYQVADNDSYAVLFEAAWVGDLSTIKAMTLQSWGKDSQNAPLEAAVTDAQGFTIFSLALFRGHEDVARAVLEIVHAQYDPPKDKKKFSISVGEDDDAIKIDSEIVDDVFTTEILAGISTKVRSKQTPLTVIGLNSSITRFLHMDDAGSEILGPLLAWGGYAYRGYGGSALQYAIVMDDAALVTRLLDLEEDFKAPDETLSSHEEDLLLAIKFGRIPIIERLAERTGAGLVLDSMIAESGITVEEDSKFYQGLTVDGVKKKSWAKAPGGSVETSRTVVSPLLLAAHCGTEGALESCKFFAGDKPRESYQRFVNSHVGDRRLHSLERLPGGISQAITSFLDNNRELALQAAVLASHNNSPVIKFLLASMPESLHVGNSKGRTALELAFQLRQVDVARLLIEHGAYQRARNIDSDNLLHVLFTPTCGSGQRIHYRNENDVSVIGSMISLLDEGGLGAMLQERSSTDPGSMTPLARFLGSAKVLYSDDRKSLAYHLQVFKLLLELSMKYAAGADLELVSGSGDTPLHICVKRQLYEHVKILAEHKPALLHRENATGQTPLEASRDAHYSKIFSGPPSLYPQSKRRIWRDGYLGDRPIDETSLAEVPVADFAARPDETAWDKMSDVDKTWSVCEEIAGREENQGITRKLVTLWEANEVAKRLAKQQEKRTKEAEADMAARKADRSTGRRRRRYGQYGYGQTQDDDQIERWVKEKMW